MIVIEKAILVVMRTFNQVVVVRKYVLVVEVVVVIEVVEVVEVVVEAEVEDVIELIVEGGANVKLIVATKMLIYNGVTKLQMSLFNHLLVYQDQQ